MIICTFEDGHIAEPKLRHVGVEALVLKDNRVLLVKGSPKVRREVGKWGLPGGFMTINETCLQAIKREIIEETGYSVTGLTLFTINDSPNRPNNERQIIVPVYFCQAGVKYQAVDDESTEQKWFSLDNLPPKGQMAFDHFSDIELYKRYLQEKFPLPLISY